MTNSIKTVAFTAGSALIALTMVLLSIPASADAAAYAYVASTGEVKSVTANDWMSAIATAPGIHRNSGVFLLKSAADYAVIGDVVIGAK